MAPLGRLLADSVTFVPSGSVPETVNVRLDPIATVCGPGTVTTGGWSVSVTVIVTDFVFVSGGVPEVAVKFTV